MKGQHPVIVLGALVVASGLAAVLLLPISSRQEVQAQALTCSELRAAAGLQGDGPCLRLDLDPDTAGIQNTVTVSHPATFEVDLVLENPPEAVGPIQFSLLYDDTVIVAPEASAAAKAPPALDGNPDINQTALGAGLDCNILNLAPPRGDKRPATGLDNGEAFIACSHLAGTFSFTSTGVLATVIFDTLDPTGPGADTSSLTLDTVVIGNQPGAEMGSCNPNVSQPMPCTDGSVTVQGPPTPTNTPTPTVTPTPTNTPTPTATPTATPLPGEPPDVTVTKTDLSDPVLSGESIIYELVVENRGLEDAANVTVTDTLPSGSTFAWAGPDCAQTALLTVTCLLEVLPGNDDEPGGPDEAVFTIVADAPSVEEDTLVVNSVEVEADNEPFFNTGNNSDSEGTVVLAPVPDLVLAKDDDPDPLQSPGTLIYTVNVSNQGEVDALGVELTDSLPPEAFFVAASAGCLEDSGTVTCDLGTILADDGAPGGPDEAIVTIEVSLPLAESDDVIVNTATATADNEPFALEGNNTAFQVTVVLAPRPDVTLTKTESADPVASGGALSYTLAIRNLGMVAATDVSLTDNLPADVTFVSASPGCGLSDHSVTCSLDDLAADDSSSGGPDEATVVMSVTAPVVTSDRLISNVASVEAGNEPFANEGNNSDTEQTVVLAPPPDLLVTKSDSPDPVDGGGALAYLISVRNMAAGDAFGVTLVDTLPADSEFVSASAGCLHAGGVVTCDLGTMAANDEAAGGPDETALAIFTNAPTSLCNRTLVNEAEASASNEPPENLGNNSALAETSVVGCPDVNEDGVVNILDMQLVGINLSDRPGVDGNHDGVFGYAPELDVNCDGVINILDLQIVGLRLGDECL